MEIVRHLESTEPAIASMGCKIVHNLTIEDFERVLSVERPPVMILFSHWKDNSVEFADGVFDIFGIIERIPNAYSGILDLAICTPKSLAVEVARRKENCLVRYSDTKATPYYWVYFYLVVFKILSEYRVTYLQAIELAVDAFLSEDDEPEARGANGKGNHSRLFRGGARRGNGQARW
ncbi:MAG: hypothetical protein ACREDR_06115 [Blastocatellia bacterium]